MSNAAAAPWEIPESWVWTEAGQVAGVVGGGTPSTKDASYWAGGTVPWLTPADLSGYSQVYIAQGLRSITQAGFDASAAQLLPVNTVLFTSRAPIGYVAIASAPLTTNQGFKSFVPGPSLQSRYLYHFLRGNRRLALDLASGTTFPEISGRNAALIPIALPPLDEQTRIVAAIEEHLTRLDAAVAGLKRTQASLKRYRAAVRQAACSGRLDGFGGPAGNTMHETDDFPGHWPWRRIGDLAEVVEYGSSARTSEGISGIPVLRMGNLVEGRLSLEHLKFLPANHREFPKLLLRPGDLLFNRTNSAELVGKTAVFRGFPNPCSFASYLIRLRFTDEADPDFVATYLNSSYGRRWVRGVVAQQVGQANVNGSKLKALEIPLPPIAVQRRIVAEVDRRFAIIDRLSKTVDAALVRAARLRQAILKRAFEGKLVPQDPNDEPASVLLERIRQNRAANPPQPRRRRRQ